VSPSVDRSPEHRQNGFKNMTRLDGVEYGDQSKVLERKIMSVSSKITGAEFDAMVDRGAFDGLGPRKIQLIRGELCFASPAGPVHDDYIDYLTRWSVEDNKSTDANIRVQCGFVCDDNRPEPDILWLKPRRYGGTRPTAADVMLLMEVSDSSLANDLREKANVYAESGVAEYWVVDVPASRIHVMTSSDGKHYRSIEIVVPPIPLSPKCRPEAILNTAELFEVREE
jgi:Uma2 family endonuclease